MTGQVMTVVPRTRRLECKRQGRTWSRYTTWHILAYRSSLLHYLSFRFILNTPKLDVSPSLRAESGERYYS